MVNANQEMVIEGEGLKKLSKTANNLLQMARGCRVWLLHGEMGSGKTTLIKALCKVIGVVDNVTSPTFSIVNEYISGAEPVYHFDFYRVKTLEEALQAGVEDYFYSDNYCFVEWPEIILPILPKEYLDLIVNEGVDENRNYKLSLHGSN